MPTSSESLTAMKPLRIFFYKTVIFFSLQLTNNKRFIEFQYLQNKSTAPSRTIEIVRNNQFDSFQNQSSSTTRVTTPRDIYTSTDHLREVPNNERWYITWKTCLLLTLLILLLLFAIGIFAMLIATLVLLTKPTTTSYFNTIELFLATTTTTTTTKTTSTTVKCVSPYVQAPSGNCINILIDINNCGKINNVCPSTYTSCSAGLCSTLSSIKIINGTFIWAASVNGSVDDKYFTITVPFNITLYNTTTTSITVTTNGVICLQTCSTTFTETALPTSAFSGATILPYWDDLYIYANTSQGIYYQKQGNAPNQTFIVEYYCSHYQQSTDYYNFQVIFFENMPGVVQFIYYEVTDEGASSTVGVQDSSSGPFVQYSFDQASSVTQNMTLIFDTNTGTYTSSSIG
ncbi:unnamed protein product [Rotaria sp. Silwood1]|nr:unnamed protein product [Rotaria sp. Silwood1]CAF4730027.1 unnamed protein product [Rotaria sp. Silwood1]CAF4799773.1 unnamed protein product [Rotaria sp. Silwood1]